MLENDATAFDLDAGDTDDATADYSQLSDVSSARYGGSFTNKILFYFESDYKAPVYYLGVRRLMNSQTKDGALTEILISILIIPILQILL